MSEEWDGLAITKVSLKQKKKLWELELTVEGTPPMGTPDLPDEVVKATFIGYRLALLVRLGSTEDPLPSVDRVAFDPVKEHLKAVCKGIFTTPREHKDESARDFEARLEAWRTEVLSMLATWTVHMLSGDNVSGTWAKKSDVRGTLPFKGSVADAIHEAVEELRPKKGSGIDSVTLSCGDASVTLLPKDEEKN